MQPTTRDHCQTLDTHDPLAAFREEFHLPPEVIYLNGNSLGALPRATPHRVADLIEREWGQGLAHSWTAAGWWDKPRTLGARLAPLIGAEDTEVVVTDNVTTNLFKTLIAALRCNPRPTILTEQGNFSTDLYITSGAAEIAGVHEQRIDVDSPHLPTALAHADASVLLLSHVDYRTATLRDLPAITRLAHEHNTLVIWDLSHSVGALPIHLNAASADFAVGCTYKYLNAGPGTCAFTYVARRHHIHAAQPIQGWHGHADPFSFDADYTPAPGASRFLSGSHPLIADAALEASLDLWDHVDLTLLRAKSLTLTGIFLDIITAGGLTSATPHAPEHRGSHVAVQVPDTASGPAIIDALAARGIHAGFRAPNLLRFGFAPLYLRHTDAYDAATTLVDIIATETWRHHATTHNAPMS
ncbi:kynureninase [Lipingzhangella sp. LS1_29]|uniref:Kynureninase n=1 Tax=Lipingzhangella rawalii TaxID=2055835 RepID=A0ABU2H1G3_9ACTN|nr:kynureninase [Lipingzhangella rawalii]MDS1269138.1 kynureninase [Lipingzhangella rawalii]